MRNDRGYALIVALAAVAAFAYLAFQVLTVNEGALATAKARADRGRLTAAADSAIMIAVHGLGQDDFADRWTVDGAPRQLDFDGVELTVAVEDERAKAPLAGLNEAQARILFEGGGASGERLAALVEEFDSWRDQSLSAHPAGLPAAADAPHRFRSVGELMALQDMDISLYGRIAPSVTVFFEPGGHFEPEFATPLALATMQAPGARAAAQDPFSFERPAEQIVADDHLAGRTLSVHVLARDQNGGEARRTAVVELTGDKTEPYWVRYVE